VGAARTVTLVTEPATHQAEQRNRQLIAYLLETGVLRDTRVRDAFAAMPRHLFLPDLPLDDVYQDAAIPTKRGSSGQPISSSSQPAIMAIMLEQLQVERGRRVLEIGAGTGYNAALLAHLAEPGGLVVTLDYDEDICADARRHLAAAGAEGVRVVQADGAGGWLEDAPYDRIELTVGADDVTPAWFDQLTLGGRLVVPLQLAGPLQLSVGFRREPDRLDSDTVTYCGFMPLRGEATFSPGAGRQEEELRALLREPAVSSGVVLPGRDLRAGFETWFALTHPGYVMVRPDPSEPGTFGLRGDRGLAVVGSGGDRAEVLLHGDGVDAAAELARAHADWGQRQPRIQDLHVTAYPGGGEPAEVARTVRSSETRTFRRRNTTFVLEWR
jgi:protein-L-isoaspartate(D-aspartate) O-methyltransferase